MPVDRPRHPLVIRPWKAGQDRQGKSKTGPRVPQARGPATQRPLPPSRRKGRGPWAPSRPPMPGNCPGRCS